MGKNLKRQVQLRMTEEGRANLDHVAKLWGMHRNEAVECLALMALLGESKNKVKKAG